MAEFIMPSLGADMTAGTLAKWRVAAGDRVSQGDIIAEVETDKGLIEVEVFESGLVEKLLVEEGAKVPVGTSLAEIAAGAGTVSEAAPVSETVSEAAPATVPATVPVSVPETAPVPEAAPATVPVSETVPEAAPVSETAPVPVSGAVSETVPVPVTAPVSAAVTVPALPGGIISSGASKPRLDGPMASPAVRRRAHELDVPLEGMRGSGEHGRITLEDLQGAARGVEPSADRARISPYARRLAIEQGLDLGKLRGTGPAGAIQASDVLGAKRSGPSPSESAPNTPAERMQRAIAAAMTRANDEIPHYYVEHSIDMGGALDWLRQSNASRSVSERLVSGVLVLRAVAKALRKHGALNATWQAGEAVPSAGIHVGLAVSLRGGGLVAPALQNTDEGSLDDLMTRMTDLVGRARAGALRSSEMTSATITLTSLGERGVESVTPIIFPPQVAIVGCGAILERPWVLGDQVIPRPIMRVTLGADHRVSNGHQGARFLSALDRLLQEPEKL